MEAEDPLAVEAMSLLAGSPPRDRSEWIEAERRVQELHVLSSIMTRTRKRDVLTKVAVRRPAVHRCQFTPEEESLYTALVGTTGRLGWSTSELSLGQVTRARQAASSLPAALEARGERPPADDDDAVEAMDLLPSEWGALADSAGERLAAAGTLAPVCRDSKYEKLREILSAVSAEDPAAKVLVFTYFVGTSRYLERRLREDGIGAIRIAGDVPSNPRSPDEDVRGRLINRFRDDPVTRILVSTEVGSEGLDFQFCRHLVNYDLPWNPMVVEQRIGRIDRFGQTAEAISIHNLVVAGTIEDRILERLYQRIGIFRQSLGDLESIVGETIHELRRDYVSGALRPEEAEQRVEQAAQAVARRRQEAEQLEARASELLGHEDYIRAEMDRVGRLGRHMSSRLIHSAVTAYLEAAHPDLRIYDEEPGVYGVRLSDRLRRDLHVVSSLDQPWREVRCDGQLLFATDGEVAYRRPDVEILNRGHPLFRAALQRLPAVLRLPSARAAQAVLRLDASEDAELPVGLFYVMLFQLSVEGLRARSVVEPVAWSCEQARILEGESAERLLHLATERGEEWDRESPAPSVPPEVARAIDSEARRRFQALRASEGRENEARYLRRRTVVCRDADARIAMIQRKIQTARERGRPDSIQRLFQAQAQKAEAVRDARLAELDRSRTAVVRLCEPYAACAIEVRRSMGG